MAVGLYTHRRVLPQGRPASNQAQLPCEATVEVLHTSMGDQVPELAQDTAGDTRIGDAVGEDRGTALIRLCASFGYSIRFTNVQLAD